MNLRELVRRLEKIEEHCQKNNDKLVINDTMS